MARRVPLAAVALTLLAANVAAQVPSADPATRTVYLTVTGKDGAPVEDLAPGDLEIKEGGRVVRIDDLHPATEPLQIALIVDDNGTGLFRAALARFIGRMEGRAAMSLSSVTGQTMKLVDYTADLEALYQGVATLNARPGTPDGGQLMEGISEAAIELRRRNAQRPVIIALTVGGEEHSTAHADDVLNKLRQSGAALHVFSVAASALRSTVVASAPSALLQENMHLSRVLGDGPKQSGGRHEAIVASAGVVMGLQHLAAELTQQYKVRYTLPPGARPSARLSVSAKRRGIDVRAPSRIPN